MITILPSLAIVALTGAPKPTAALTAETKSDAVPVPPMVAVTGVENVTVEVGCTPVCE